MTERRTNLSKLNSVSATGGCQVCIGCGRCERIHQDMHVLVNFLPQIPGVKSAAGMPPMESEDGYAMAVDLGTTTIAMCMTDGNGQEIGHYCRLNPQRKWGMDVLSRIQAAKQEDNRHRLQECVWRMLEEGLEELQKKMPDASAPVVVGLAGNTTMLYLLQGYAPDELGCAPFSVTHGKEVHTALSGYPMYGFPPLSAFVGGDILSGIWGSGMWQSKKQVLLIDLGTNGEIVLGNRERMVACATAAGPAFEGGPCMGIWGADMMSLVAELLDRRLVDDTGLLADPYFEHGILIGGVRITQAAIRALQLAKGAIRSGIEILLEECGIAAEEVEQVILAGGLGYYLQPKAAVRIGLLPATLAKKTVAGGNTALQGALKASLDIRRRGVQPVLEEWERVRQLVRTINLATHPGFQEQYLEFMNFTC